MQTQCVSQDNFSDWQRYWWCESQSDKDEVSLPHHTDLLLAFRTIPEIDTSDFHLVFDTRITRGTRISQQLARLDTEPWLTEAETLITPKCIPDFDFRRTTGFKSHASQMTRHEKHLPVEDRGNSQCCVTGEIRWRLPTGLLTFYILSHRQLKLAILWCNRLAATCTVLS